MTDEPPELADDDDDDADDDDEFELSRDQRRFPAHVFGIMGVVSFIGTLVVGMAIYSAAVDVSERWLADAWLVWGFMWTLILSALGVQERRRTRRGDQTSNR